jgi:hypothetical protein
MSNTFFQLIRNNAFTFQTEQIARGIKEILTGLM